jgi:hypothetical protein
VTGEPLRGTVEYFALSSNPNLRDFPGFDGTFLFLDAGVGTKEDGSYRVVGLPGPGLVAAYPPKNHYLRAPEREDEYGTKEGSLSTAPYQLSFTSNYSALARINPFKGVDSVTRDVTLDPGWRIKGTVLGPDGQPLAGAFGMRVGQMKTAEFTMRGLNPRRSRELLFRHPAKGLIGLAPPPKVNGGSITVRLQPGAAVAGRLVDADGRPQADVALSVRFGPKGGPAHERYSTHERITTDRDGRFLVEALPPGEFQLWLRKGRELLAGDGLRRGQTKDLGDVLMKGREP